MIWDCIERQKFILQSDNEPAIKELQRSIKRNRVEDTILQNAPRYDPKSNGLSENAVQLVKQLANSNRSALEARMGKPLPRGSHATAWLIEHGPNMYSMYKVGDDGKTSYKRVTGRNWTQETIEF